MSVNERKPVVVGKLVVVGDEAWTEAEWRSKQRRLEHRRAQYRAAKHRSKLRHLGPEPVGFLHELACTGPHIGNSRCIPIPVYTRRVTR